MKLPQLALPVLAIKSKLDVLGPGHSRNCFQLPVWLIILLLSTLLLIGFLALAGAATDCRRATGSYRRWWGTGRSADQRRNAGKGRATGRRAAASAGCYSTNSTTSSTAGAAH